jgi:hypothetical protein
LHHYRHSGKAPNILGKGFAECFFYQVFFFSLGKGLLYRVLQKSALGKELVSGTDHRHEVDLLMPLPIMSLM